MHPVNFFYYFFYLFFFSPQSRFSWVSESFSQDIGRILTWKVFFTKIYLSMKTPTDFRKTVETGVDPRLGEGVLYTMAYTGRLHLKGLPFSSLRYIKGKEFN